MVALTRVRPAPRPRCGGRIALVDPLQGDRRLDLHFEWRVRRTESGAAEPYESGDICKGSLQLPSTP